MKKRRRKKVVALPGLEPGCPQGRAIFVPLRLSPPHAGSWSGLSLHHTPAFAGGLGAARPVSTPSRFRAWLGISSEAFPDFERFYAGHFHPGTQFTMSRVRLPFRQRANGQSVYSTAFALQRAGCRSVRSCRLARRSGRYRAAGFARTSHKADGQTGADGVRLWANNLYRYLFMRDA